MVATWNVLDDINTLDRIIEDSHHRPVVLFKHSISCGISARAQYMLEAQWNLNEEDLDFYILDLINNRNISNAIEERLQVKHQSPQLIVVKNGKAVFNVSHHRVDVSAIHSALDSLN